MLWVIYFLHGLCSDLPDIARLYYLSDCGYSASAVTLLDALFGIPWLSTIGFGVCMDKFAWRGSHRTTYICAAQLLGAYVWFLLAMLPTSDNGMSVFLFLIAETTLVCWSVGQDALVVAQNQATQNHCATAYMMGRTMGSLLGGGLKWFTSSPFIFGIQSCVMLGASFISMQRLVDPPPTSFVLTEATESIRSIMTNNRSTIGFLLLFNAIPTTRIAFFYYMTQIRHKTPMDMGALDAMACLFAGLISFGYQFTKNERGFYISSSLAALLCSVSLVLLVFTTNDGAFVLSMAQPLSTALANCVFLPYMFRVSAETTKNQGTVYATLLTIPALGRIVSYIASFALIRVFKGDFATIFKISYWLGFIPYVGAVFRR